MEGLLVYNPQKYVVEYIGSKNEKDLRIAIEIFLSELSLVPDFTGFLDSDIDYADLKGWLVEVKNSYLLLYPSHFEKSVLNPLYFFHYLDYGHTDYHDGYSGTLFSERVLPFVAFDFIKESYEEMRLESQVAKLMFKTDQFYKRLNGGWIKTFEKVISTTSGDVTEIETAKNKILGGMVLQHRELYDLEQKRIQNMKEYDFLEKYIADFKDTFTHISNELVVY